MAGFFKISVRISQVKVHHKTCMHVYIYIYIYINIMRGKKDVTTFPDKPVS